MHTRCERCVIKPSSSVRPAFFVATQLFQTPRAARQLDLLPPTGLTPLRRRMLEDLQVCNLSPHTQPAYVENVARFARHFGRSPARDRTGIENRPG